MNPPGKPLVWLRGEIKTPPFSPEVRVRTPTQTMTDCKRRLKMYDETK